MARSQRYIIVKETTYFPEAAYNEKQQSKASMKNKLVHLLHSLLLFLVPLVFFLVLKDTPPLGYFLAPCANGTRSIQEERALFGPLKHMDKARGELHQLANTSSAHDPSYDVNAMSAVFDNITVLKNAAEASYDEKYHGFSKCVYAEVKTYNGSYTTLARVLLVSFIIVFLISFLVREILTHFFVKEEFTQAGWKKEAPFNTMMTCIWLVLGAYFIYYLCTVAEEGNQARNGQVASYFSTL